MDMLLTFIDKNYHWPAFNVADISISFGIGLWILAEIIQAKRRLSNERRRTP